MGNGPIRFDPPDWQRLFEEHGWHVKQMRYLGEESRRFHRPVPMPPLVKVMRAFAPKEKRRQMLRNTGYAMLERSP